MKTPLSSSRPDGAGFTLLELMIAISILALVLTMIAGSFNAVAHSKIHGEERLSVDREGRALLAELSSEFRGAIQTPIVFSRVVLIGNPQTRDRLPLDGVTISTLEAGHRRSITSFGSEELVLYSLAPNPEHRKWFLLTRNQMSALITSPSGSRSQTSAVIADNVVSLHFRYYDGNTNDWVETWDSSALPRPQQLPVAVSIDLALGTDDGHVMNFSTAVYVPMAVAVW